MLKSCFAVILIIIGTQTNAQLLDGSKNLFSDEPFFNIDFVKVNKIKAITGELLYKKDNEIIQSRNKFIRYDFDSLGRMFRIVNIFIRIDSIVDTTISAFHYDEKNRMITKRVSDNFGFYSLNYDYDSHDNITKGTYCREISSGNSQSNFVLAKQYPIAFDAFEYEYLSAIQYKKKTLNNLGKPYKEIIVNKNQAGQIVEEYGKLIVTSKIEKINYAYDEKYRLIEKVDYSNVSEENKIVFKYKYDIQNNILEFEKYQNDVLIFHSEFLYDENHLFTSQVSRDEGNKTIDISKYSYDFFE